GRVAVEAAADRVVDPTGRHLLEGQGHHREGARVRGVPVEAEEPGEVRRPRELGRAPKSSVRRIEGGAEFVESAVEDGDIWQPNTPGLLGHLLHAPGDLAGLLGDA